MYTLTLRNMKYTLPFLLLIFVGLQACNKQQNQQKKPIARIHDKNLYLSDIAEIIPDNKSEEDSILIAKNYIQNWIKKQLLLKKAESNLPEESKNIQKQIDEYKTSLLIYRYQQQYIDQKLDTTVTEKEIDTYYENNTSNFTLDQNLVKVLYIELPINSPNLSSVKRWYKSDNEESIMKLEDYCYQYAEKFDDFDNEWIIFDNLIRNIPSNIDNSQRFLRYNTHLEVQDSLYHYLIKINDYKLKGTPAPVSYVRGKIKSVILNKRKHQLIEKLENDIYNEALNRNEFIIY